MQLYCHVSGKTAKETDGFTVRLCNRAAKALDASLIGEDGFKRAMRSSDDMMLTRLDVETTSRTGLEYSITRGTAQKWAQGSVEQSKKVIISVMDGPLDAAIDQLARDLKRLK